MRAGNLSDRQAEDGPERRRLLSRRRFLQAATTLPILGAAGCTSAKAGTGTSTTLATTTTTTTVPLGTADAGPPTEAGVDPEPVTVLKAGPTAPGYIFVTPGKLKNGEQEGPMIVDNDGQVVWFKPLKAPIISTNLQVQAYKGEPVLAWWEGRNVLPGYGQGHYEIYDSSYRQVTQVHGKNGLMGDLHEFVITPEGTALFTAYRVQHTDLRSVGGSRDGVLLNSLMQEVDIATGKLLFEWDSAKHIPLSESYVQCPKKAIWDWFHINSIDIDTDGNLLISSRHLWAVFKIDRSSGKVIWRLNGKASDFKMEKGSHFSWQHTVRHQPGGTMSIFDDGAGTRKTENESRGIILKIDQTNKVASLVQAYLPTPKLLAGSQGSIQLLPDNHVFVGWGAYPYYSEYDYNGTLLYNARLPKPTHSYRAYRYEWSGKPGGAPLLEAKRVGQKVQLSASWNGATEIDRWQVLSGASESTLRAVGDFDFKGFVTTMAVAGSAKQFAVTALAADGSVLGRSKLVSA